MLRESLGLWRYELAAGAAGLARLDGRCHGRRDLRGAHVLRTEGFHAAQQSPLCVTQRVCPQVHPRLPREVTFEDSQQVLSILDRCWTGQATWRPFAAGFMARGASVSCAPRSERWLPTSTAWSSTPDPEQWPYMTPGSVLRAALGNLLPRSVLERRKSPYPRTNDFLYIESLQPQAAELLDDSHQERFGMMDTQMRAPGARHASGGCSTRSPDGVRTPAGHERVGAETCGCRFAARSCN
jgi:hypothetical protein